MPRNLSIQVLNINTGNWVPYSSNLACYYLQQAPSSPEFYPVAYEDGYCRLSSGSLLERSAVRMNWRNTYYEMGTRAVSGFRKPGQSKRSDFVLRVVNPQNAFRNFKEQSLTSDGGKVFSIRWDIAGRGDAWVSRGLSSGGIIRMQDVAGLRARSMLITGGTSWLPEDTVIRPVILNNMGEAHIVQDE